MTAVISNASPLIGLCKIGLLYVLSDISIIEFYSALSLKVRVGEIDEENFMSLRKLFSNTLRGGFTKFLLKYAHEIRGY